MDRLAELRERRALTLRELSDMSGVSADTINQIELGHRKARPSTLRKLAKALDIEVREFFEEPALPKAEAPEAGLGGESGPDREDNLEVLRRIEKALLHIAEQYRTTLKSINIDAPDRKATADQLISLLAQVFWSYRGAKEYVEQDAIVQEAAAGSYDERRRVRKVRVALDTLYDVFDEIGSAVDSFARTAGKEDASIIYAEERFRQRAG